MCTLCLSDMGELRDDWLRAPKAKPLAVAVVELASAKPVLAPATAIQNASAATAPSAGLAEAA